MPDSPNIPCSTAIGRACLDGWCGLVTLPDGEPMIVLRLSKPALGCRVMCADERVRNYTFQSLRLDLARPEVQHRLADVLEARGVPTRFLLPKSLGGSLPPEHAQHTPVLLAEQARRVEKGERALRALLGAWRHQPNDKLWTWSRRVVGSTQACDFPVIVGNDGWHVDATRGPECEEQGKADADEAALTHGYALLLPSGGIRVAP